MCPSRVAPYTIHIPHVQQGGEPAKHSIALPCLLSGGENEDRKWADGAGEQGGTEVNGGMSRDWEKWGRRARLTGETERERGGGRQARTNGWKRAERQEEWHSNLRREPTRDTMTGPASTRDEEEEREGKNARSVTEDLSVRRAVTAVLLASWNINPYTHWHNSAA